MLVLTFKDGESLYIGDDIKITVYSHIEDHEGERVPDTVELAVEGADAEVVSIPVRFRQLNCNFAQYLLHRANNDK